MAGLLNGDDEARLTAVGVAEVIDHLVRLVGSSEDDAALDIAQLGLAGAALATADPHLLDLCHHEAID